MRARLVDRTKSEDQVNNDFNTRNGPGMTAPNSFIWAVWTAEGSDYLEKLDDNVGGRVLPDGTNPGSRRHLARPLGDANAITAIDLCAATINRAKSVLVHNGDDECFHSVERERR